MNQIIKIIIITIAALTINVASLYAEELKFIQWEGEKTILFDGDFSTGTSTRLNLFLTENSERRMIMNSPGGLFDEGISTGRIIRDMGVKVIIPSKAVCISACAFAAIASEDIVINGMVAFHRPYYDHTKTSPDHVYTRAEIFVGGHYTGQVALHYLMTMGFSPTFSGYVMVSTSEDKFLVIKKTVELLPLVVNLDMSMREVLEHNISTEYLTSMTYTSAQMAVLYSEINQPTAETE